MFFLPSSSFETEATPADSNEPLGLWSDSHRPCSLLSMAKISRIIESADPDHAPTAHRVRTYASSLTFLKSLNLEKVKEAGHSGRNANSVNRHLTPHLQHVPMWK